MACGNAEKPWPRRKRFFPNRMFLCPCLCGEKESSQEQEEKMNGGLDLDKMGSGEKNAFRIPVEDLGIVNGSFSLWDEDPGTPENVVACLSSSETTCERKPLRDLSSLAAQPQVQLTTTQRVKEGEEEEEELQLFENGTDDTPGSGVLLTTPAIHLIPPTPCNITIGNQFFDSNLEESMTHACGNGGLAPGDEEKRIIKIAEEPSAECTPADVTTAEVESESKHEGRSEELGEQKEAEASKKWDNDKFKPKFSWSSDQGDPLPFCTKKSEYQFIQLRSDES